MKRMYKKIISAVVAVFMLLGCRPFTASALAAQQQTAQFPEMQVEVKAKAAVLMEASTGKVLMASNAHEKLPPASVTKIMTLLLVTEAIDAGKIALTDLVTTSTEASKLGGSQIWLKEGETMTVDDLLKATAVYSANDACTVLSEYIGGSREAFVKMMNARAKELGMNDTYFENCTGLDDTAANHVTSAYDIALMSRELIKHKLITNYTTLWMDTLRGGQTQLVNTNKLIRFYEGATGLKTGTTSKAGCCVSATAERDGLSLIAVVLGSDNSNDRFDGAKTMLNWGFANYSAVKLEIDRTLITDVNVIKGYEDKVTPVIPEGISVIVEKGQEDSVRQVVDLAVDVAAPVEKGQVLGTVTFKLGEEVLCEYALSCDREVRKLTFIDMLRRVISALA